MKALFLVILLSLSNVYAQNQANDREEIIEKFMKNRKAMMDKMLDAFSEDSFFEDDMDDDFFKSILGNRFDKFKNHKMVSVEEIRKKSGDIDVFIKPEDETIKLDIETKDSVIIVKAKKIEKIENNSASSFSSRLNNQSSMQSVSIPEGYEAKSPKTVGDKILIALVKKRTKIQKINSKTPLLKRKGEGTI
jgi:hypothetical protein